MRSQWYSFAMYQRKGCAWLLTSPNNIRSEWTAASLTAARQGRFVVDKVTVAVARVHALPGQGACSVQETLSAGERPGEKPGGDRTCLLERYMPKPQNAAFLSAYGATAS